MRTAGGRELLLRIRDDAVGVVGHYVLDQCIFTDDEFLSLDTQAEQAGPAYGQSYTQSDAECGAFPVFALADEIALKADALAVHGGCR